MRILLHMLYKEKIDTRYSQSLSKIYVKHLYHVALLHVYICCPSQVMHAYSNAPFDYDSIILQRYDTVNVTLILVIFTILTCLGKKYSF